MSAVSMAPGSPEIGTSECDDGVDPTPHEACAKAPDHFGAKKTKNLQSGLEPQMNGDVGPGPAVASREGQERPSSVANATAYPKANQAVVQSKVPKFGAWEGGDKNYKYIVYFDGARDLKHSGKKINLNDPEENPDMFRTIKDSAQTQPRPRTPRSKHSGKEINLNDHEENPDIFRTIKNSAQTQPQPRTRGDKQRTHATIPQFGAWNTDPSQAEGYTRTFARAREDSEERPSRPGLNNDTLRNYGRAPWIRDLFVDSGRHQPSVHEDAYGGGNRTTYDQIPLGNESQANVASTPRNLPEQKPTKQKKGRRFYWFRRRSGRERNAVP